MATVAIIHAADDALPARALAEKLRQAQLTVVLEQQPGEELRNAVKSAQVTIALWSPRSVTQPQLADEVAFARGKSKLIHASMQNATPPDAFRGDKAVNLTGWRGEDDFPAWRELAKIVADKAGVGPLPPPPPRPPSGFFQPGAYNPNAAAAADARGPAPRPASPRPAQSQSRSAPPPRASSQRENLQPREPSSGGNRGLIIGAIVFVVVAALGGGGYYFWQQGQSAQVATSAWDSVDHNSARALRDFLANDPGEHRADAERALAELEERSFEAASDSDTIEAFEGFLNDFPESGHALAARGRIAELRTLQPSTTTADGASTTATGSTTDPDLLPPTASTTPAPAAPGTPVPLSPPATEQTPAEQPPVPSTTP